MENKNNNTILIILLVTFILSTLSLGGYIIYDKSSNKQDCNNKEIINNDSNTSNDNNNENEYEQKEKNNLDLYTQSDILNLLSENGILLYLNFSSSNNLLKENKKENYSKLMRGLQTSEYNQKAPEGYMNHFLVTLSNIKKYLKENFNYDYSDSEIKEYFKEYYDEKEKSFIFYSTGWSMPPFVKEMYEENGEYYIELSETSEFNKKGIVVLKQENNQFYFYSSTGLN